MASADEETKERVAKAGGEARAYDKVGLSEAGRKGESVSRQRAYVRDWQKRRTKLK